MKLKFPHIPRFFSAMLPSVGRSFLWTAMIAMVVVNVYFVLAKPTAFVIERVNLLQRPFTAPPHQTLAQAYWGSGARSRATHEVKLAREYDSVLGATTLSPQAEEKIQRYWEGVTSRYPDYRDAYIQLALVAYQQGNVPRAIEYLSQARETDPNNEVVGGFLSLLSSLGPAPGPLP